MFGSTRLYAGIDVGDALIKVAVVEAKGEAVRLVKAASVPTPDGAVVDAAVVDPGAVAGALRDALDEGPKVKVRAAVPMVPGAHLAVRSLSLPPMSPAELKDAARWEAAQYLPFPAEEASYDVVELAKEAELVEALFIGCRGSVVDGLVTAVEAAGLTCLAVEAAPAALPRLEGRIGMAPREQRAAAEAAAAAESKALAFVDLGARHCNVAIFKDGLLRVNRTIPLGGRDIEEAVASATGAVGAALQKLLAEVRLPVSPGEDEGARAALAVAGVLDDLVPEVQRSLDYFRAQNQWLPIDQVVLVGGASLIPGIEEFLAEGLEIKVTRPEVSALAGRGLAGLNRFGRKELALYGGALGAALREVSNQ